jgi:FkbM family methyltransferase
MIVYLSINSVFEVGMTNKKMCIFGEDLCFNVSNDLEKYRVESALNKEAETIAWIDGWDLNDNETVFYDIGANIGIYSLYAAFMYPVLSVFSFEPTSNNYTSLQQNVWLNEFSNIFSFNLALAKNSGITNLYFSDLRKGNSGAQINHALNEKGEEYDVQRVEKVLAVSLDRLVFEYNFPVPSYVKIDVDGHEPEILDSMLKTLAEPGMKSILVEFNNDNEFLDWSRRLEEFGFRRDYSYEGLPNHSSHRRLAGGGSARNYIFTR